MWWAALAVLVSAARRAGLPAVVGEGLVGLRHAEDVVLPLVGAALLRLGVAELAREALGLIALVIALVGDLPDARASGLVGSSATRFLEARSSPAVGLYLETLGAVLLLLASGLGLLMLGAGEGARRHVRWFAS